MSGIAGIIHLDGSAIDPSQLKAMRDCLAQRGPDGQTLWHAGSAGLVHALLRTTTEAAEEQQPCSLEGQVWIAADARVDGQAELRRALAAAGRTIPEGATDALLILHAYHAWGEACVAHLLGDFAFAIWDSARQRLFCGRDQFGIKPFYFVTTAERLLFSNTLNCLRTHPDVSDALNEPAIADFLLIGGNPDPATTAFVAIRRLPPAHTLTWSPGAAPRTQRYWTLPAEHIIRYRHAADYAEHFNALLRSAVADRLRTDQVGILMSGGLDSTSVAAAAAHTAQGKFAPTIIRGYTVFYQQVYADQEGDYAGLAAQALGIPHHRLAADGYRLFERVDQHRGFLPEPLDWSAASAPADLAQQIASQSRVALTGEGGDPVFYPSQTYLFDLAEKMQWGTLVAEVRGFARSYGRMPPLYIRTRLKRRLNRTARQPAFPMWLAPALVRQLDLRARWESLMVVPEPDGTIRAEARRRLSSRQAVTLFETYDPGVSGLPLEIRHPYYDLRLVAFVLSVPPVPWCVDKMLLRTAMQGILPDAVRTRPKSPAVGSSGHSRWSVEAAPWVARLMTTPGLARFVDLEHFGRMAAMPQRLLPHEANLLTRPLSLALWLRQFAPAV